MCTYFGGLFDYCIHYLRQSFHLIIDKTHHIMIMFGQLPLFVLFLVKIIQQSLKKVWCKCAMRMHAAHAFEFVSFEFEYHFFFNLLLFEYTLLKNYKCFFCDL